MIPGKLGSSLGTSSFKPYCLSQFGGQAHGRQAALCCCGERRFRERERNQKCEEKHAYTKGRRKHDAFLNESDKQAGL